MLRRLKDTLLRLHRDEQGADMVEYILIVAAVALPMVAVLIWFWRDISAWAGELWQEVKTGGDDTDPSTLGH